MAAEPSHRFRKEEHIRRGADFRRVYDRKLSAADGILLLYGCGNGLEFARIGISISRRVGNAVVRNRLRRLYREAYRLTRTQLPGGLDFVMIPRSSTEPALEELKQSLIRLAHKVARKESAS